MGCEFDIRVSGIAISKALDRSFDQGLIQIGNEIKNVFTRTQEVTNPLEAYFRTLLTIKTNKIGETALFWEGYDRSISNSMLRNAALLKLNGASKEEVEKAKAEWKMWNRLEQTTLNLGDGQAIQFLALRGIEAEQGIALQQIKREGEKLVLESQLLPFNQRSQIESFRRHIDENRKETGILPENEAVDSLVSWTTEGKAIDFKQDLPDLINQANREPLFFNRIAVAGFWFTEINWHIEQEAIGVKPGEIINVLDVSVLSRSGGVKYMDTFEKDEEGLIKYKERVDLIGEREGLSFEEVRLWLEVLKQESIEVLPGFITEVVELKPIRADIEILEDPSQKLEVTKGAEVTMEAIKPARRVLAGEETLEEWQVIELSEPEITEELNIEVETTRTDLVVNEVVEVPVETARRVLAGEETSEKKLMLIKEATGSDPEVLTESPVYKFDWSKLKPLALTDIPEWVWQPQAAGLDEAVDWDLLLVIAFYMLLNTKLLLKIDREDGISYWPGERLKAKVNNYLSS